MLRLLRKWFRRERSPMRLVRTRSRVTYPERYRRGLILIKQKERKP